MRFAHSFATFFENTRWNDELDLALESVYKHYTLKQHYRARRSKLFGKLSSNFPKYAPNASTFVIFHPTINNQTL